MEQPPEETLRYWKDREKQSMVGQGAEFRRAVTNLLRVIWSGIPLPRPLKARILAMLPDE